MASRINSMPCVFDATRRREPALVTHASTEATLAEDHGPGSDRLPRPPAAPWPNVSKPAGTTMNSWKSVEFSACWPPLMMLSNRNGQGVLVAVARAGGKPGRPLLRARAHVKARDTPRMALLPSLDLLPVPSSLDHRPIDATPGQGSSRPKQLGPDFAAHALRLPYRRPAPRSASRRRPAVPRPPCRRCWCRPGTAARPIGAVRRALRQPRR